MIIGAFNIDESFLNLLKKEFNNVINLKDNNQYIDVLIIDYLPLSNNLTEQQILQASLLEKYSKIKKVKIIIFDRYLSMSNDEILWLNKNNNILFEPALNYRRTFKYLPCWIDIDKEIPFDHPEKKVDLTYFGNPLINISDFNHYIIEFCKHDLNNRVVRYTDNNLSKSDILNFKNFNITYEDITYKDSKFSIIIDSYKNNEIGYINPNISKMLNDFCIPIIPISNKYFNNLSFTVKSFYDIKYLLDTYDKIFYAYMFEVFEKIEKFYPEMLIKSVVERLIEEIKI